MKQSKVALYALSALWLSACTNTPAPEAVLPVPEPKQIAWQQMETYAFVHFSMNTFNDMEWGYGDADINLFNPSELDCEQWVETFKNAGLTGVIFTAKHHDGFCMWPSAYTEYSVKNAPWKDGKGDVVKDLSEACKKHGLKFAVYLSPWDRNHADYGTPSYVDYFHNQLTELMSNYGSVFEIWFDGANGGNGWYGGANDSRTIDRKNYYNYPRIFAIADSLQPQAVIFGDGGPGCRWVGNENGYAGATNWSFLREGVVYPGYPNYKELQFGHEDGNQWTAAECDVSIRPGWFYHEDQDDKVKLLSELVNIYFQSVGYNSVLLLNIPPDKRGLIHENDVRRLKEFSDYLKQAFEDNRVKKGDKLWEASKGRQKIYQLKNESPINIVLLQEDISKGQRIEAFMLEARVNGGWKTVAEGTTVGLKRLLRFPECKSKELRLTISEARGVANMMSVGAFYAEPVSQDCEKLKLSDVPISQLKVIDPEIGAEKVIDGELSTHWKSNGMMPLVVDMGKITNITGFTYAPIVSEDKSGTIFTYMFYVSQDGKNWEQCECSGEFSNIMHNPVPQFVRFGKKYFARYVKLKPLLEIDNKSFITIAEFGLLTK